MVEQGDCDISQEQAADGLVHPSVMPERAGESDPDRPHRHCDQRHRDLRRERRRSGRCVPYHRSSEAAQHERSLAADDDQARLRRQRDAQRGQDQRRRALQRVLPGEAARESAFVDEGVDLQRVFADRGHEHAEQNHRHDERADGNGDRLRGTPQAIAPHWGSHGAARGQHHGRVGHQSFPRPYLPLPRSDSSSAPGRRRSGSPAHPMQ